MHVLFSPGPKKGDFGASSSNWGGGSGGGNDSSSGLWGGGPPAGTPWSPTGKPKSGGNASWEEPVGGSSMRSHDDGTAAWGGESFPFGFFVFAYTLLRQNMQRTQPWWKERRLLFFLSLPLQFFMFAVGTWLFYTFRCFMGSFSSRVIIS